MFNLLRVLTYPNAGKKELGSLPREPGIYYFIDCFKVLYVGQSTSLFHRWQSNHKHKPRFLKSWFARLHYRSVKIMRDNSDSQNRCYPVSGKGLSRF